MFLKSENPLIATLMEEMKPVIAVKDKFSSRDKSKVIAYFGFWAYQDSDARKKKQFDLSIDLHKFQVFGIDQNGRYQVSI